MIKSLTRYAVAIRSCFGAAIHAFRTRLRSELIEIELDRKHGSKPRYY